MLGTPPPGHNLPSVNRQTLGYLNVPGYQGLSAQGYNATAPGYTMPSGASAAHLPSSQPQPQQYAGAMPPNAASMLRALRGGMA